MHRNLALAIAATTLLAAGASAQQPSAPSWAVALDSMMQREMLRTYTPGAQISVVQNGRLVYTKAYGVADIETGRPVTERTLFHTGSMPIIYRRSPADKSVIRQLMNC